MADLMLQEAIKTVLGSRFYKRLKELVEAGDQGIELKPGAYSDLPETDEDDWDGWGLASCIEVGMYCDPDTGPEPGYGEYARPFAAVLLATLAAAEAAAADRERATAEDDLLDVLDRHASAGVDIRGGEGGWTAEDGAGCYVESSVGDLARSLDAITDPQGGDHE